MTIERPWPVTRMVRCGLLVAVTAGTSGCLASTMVPALPPPVRLAADTDFTLYAIDPATQKLREHCRVRRIEGNVLSVRADTMLLSNVAVMDQARRAPSCVPTDTLVVVASRNWLVQSERTSVSPKRALLTIVLTVVIAMLATGGFRSVDP